MNDEVRLLVVLSPLLDLDPSNFTSRPGFSLLFPSSSVFFFIYLLRAEINVRSTVGSSTMSSA